MDKYIQSLKGISYSEWIKLKTAVDRSFEQKIGEFKKEIKLSDHEDVEKIIRSQFG